MATTESSASNAHDTTTPFLDRIELELDRLREKRPALDVVIDRATHILVAHVSCPCQNVIVVRIGLGGRAKLLVRSLNERGAVYTINPSIWACSCPAYHRYEGTRPCKHAIAAYILWRAARPAPKVAKCKNCKKPHPRDRLIEVRHEDHNEQYFPGDHLCRSCANGAGVQW